MPAVTEYPGCEGVVSQPWASERVIMVGQAPSARGSADPRLALTGRPMQFLFTHCGLDLMRYIRAFERHNVATTWHGYRKGTDPKTGSRFTWRQYTDRIEWLKERAHGRRILCWGREVAGALFGGTAANRMALLAWESFTYDVSGYQAGEPVRPVHSEFQAAILPHPSGLNRWWNDPDNRDAARAFMQHTVDEVHVAYGQRRLTAAPVGR